MQWKKRHPNLAVALQKEADVPTLYCVLPHEQVKVFVNEKEVNHTGTIRALAGAPNGACSGWAKANGSHPFTCVNCDTLVHGKSSALLHKLNRAAVLKHPRSEEDRALKPGVTHKYASAACLDIALRQHREQEQDKDKKLQNLERAYDKLRSAWSQSKTARPFVEILVKLFDKNKLSEFDINFLQSWLKKKDKGQYARASSFVGYTNKLGEKNVYHSSSHFGLA